MTDRRVTLSIHANSGYGPDQPRTSLTLDDLLGMVEDAIELYGGDAVVVTRDGTNRYGASWGHLHRDPIQPHDLCEYCEEADCDGCGEDED